VKGLLEASFPVPIGHGDSKKIHKFDLGSESPAILVECKSHNWTVTGNMPSAKLTVWNEAMYYFYLAPSHYRKVLFVLDARHERRDHSLAELYARTCGHLIPPKVEIIEYSIDTNSIRRVEAAG
jgi:hypothetical protein